MPYKLFSEQVHEHLMFLRSKGFDICNLEINKDFVRCRQQEINQIRGELAYKTTSKKLNNGLTGLQTWYRGHSGESDRFLTYGLGPEANDGTQTPLTACNITPNNQY